MRRRYTRSAGAYAYDRDDRIRARYAEQSQRAPGALLNPQEVPIMLTPADVTTPGHAPKRDEYRGIPLLVLPMGEGREFSFGPGKAHTIAAHLPALIDFLADTWPESGKADDVYHAALAALDSARAYIQGKLADIAPAPAARKIQTPQIDALPGMTPLGIKPQA